MTPAELDEISAELEEFNDQAHMNRHRTEFTAFAKCWMPKLLSHISKQDEELKRLREIEQAVRRTMKHVTVIEKSSD